MNTLKFSVLVFSLFLVNASTFARLEEGALPACITKGNTVAPAQREMPDNAQNSPEWEKFKSEWPGNSAIAQSYSCCTGLVLDGATRICKDKTVYDPTVKSCDPGPCTEVGKGCFPVKNEDHFFSTDSENPVEMKLANEREALFNAEMAKLKHEPRDLSQECLRDMECKSYKCGLKANATANSQTVCLENKICRFAEKNEPAPGSIKCAEPYEKVGGVCKEEEIEQFMGSIDGLTVRQVAGKQCQFELDPTNSNFKANNSVAAYQKVKDAASLAVLSSRAMEWMFATSTVEDKKDCLFTARWMKQNMQALLEKRKGYVRDFSKKYEEMEEDFKKVSTAKKDDMTVITSPCKVPGTTVHQTTTAHDINQRRATGLDYLCYLSNRNDLFLEYETKMKGYVTEMAKLADGYTSSWGWEETSKAWTLGKGDPAKWNKDYDDQDCRNWPLWHQKIKRRWGQKYVVKGDGQDNMQVLDKETPDMIINGVSHKFIDVKDYLAAIEQKNDKEAAISPYKKRKYYLLDPLMPGGDDSVKFERFGGGNQYERYLGYSSWWTNLMNFAVNPILGITNSFKARENSTGFLGMHARLRPAIKAHLKSLKASSTQKNFIYEPEIPSSFDNRVCLLKADSPECLKTQEIQSKGGCIDNLEEEECKFFKQYVDNLQDVAFAQMLAYSRHDKKKYIEFFQNKSSGRFKLFTRYDLEFNNLKHYYTGLTDLRRKENACLAAAIAQIRSPEFNGKNMGLVQGSKNYYVESKELKGSKRGKNETPLKKAAERINPFKIDINTDNMSSTNKAGSDSLKDTSGALGADINGGTGAMAAASRYMSDVNKKAREKGIDVGAREKAYLASISGTGGGSGSGASSGASGSSSSLGASGDSGAKATLDETLKPVIEVEKDQETGSGAATSATGNPAGLSSGSGYQTSSEASATDSSGMSDEEKDTMTANYDRTKSEYKTSEEDSLFQVLSKTYVRNLNKILVRKKKLEQGNNE